MVEVLFGLQQLPVAEAVEKFVGDVTQNFSFLFQFLETSGKTLMRSVTNGLLAIPPVVFIVLIALAAFFATGRKLGLAVFSVFGLLFILNQNLWKELMNTVTVVSFSSLISVVIGIPLGIWMAKSKVM